jgi:uncharacterized protein
MKKILFGFAIILIISGALYLTQNYLKEGKTISFFSKSSTVTINSHIFKVILAKSQEDKEVGLSKTKSISEDQGMLFLFEKLDYYPFWMKYMQFPIDIIYINNDTIVTILNNVALPKNSNENPTVYTPTDLSDKVLEIKAGLSEKYNFKNGDKVKYENLGN